MPNEYHPLTDAILEHIDNDGLGVHTDEIDALVRDYVTPPTVTAESSVRFPDLPETPIEVAGNFIQSGTQMQMVLVGTEPVLVVQPEFDVEENQVTLITTAVDLPPGGLVLVLEALLDGAREIAEQASELEAEMREADADLRAASDEFDASLED